MPAVLKTYNPPLEPFLDVIHQDDQIVVINKHSGILSVPGRLTAHGDCIETRAKSVFGTALSVHRLDMETSGVMVMALHKRAHSHLSRQFEARQTIKTYIAVVAGVLRDDQGEIAEPLRCDWPNRPRQMVDHENGRTAITRFKVIERFDASTRIALYPETGRSHQLRVHMLTIGHPIMGDALYGPQTDKTVTGFDDARLLLHAESLAFSHPQTNDQVRFAAECPF